jgi:hypothetical protein
MFKEFQKIARLSRECTITEKIDGTNASVIITPEGEVFAGARNGIVTVDKDNYGWAAWVEENKTELAKLGPGNHFGEWWGNKIQRGYGLSERRFSLFDTERWIKHPFPPCCSLVPILFQGIFHSTAVEQALESLRIEGSRAAPGFKNPEGVIIYHSKAKLYFKKTLLKDDEWKGKTK